MNHLAAGVKLLTGGGKGDGKDFAVSSRFQEIDRGIFHGEFGTQVGIDPFHGGVFVGRGSFGNEVVDIGGPILDGGVTTTAAFLDNYLDDGTMERVGTISWGGTAFDVVDESVFVDDDKSPFELANVFGVDAEISLERHFNTDPWRDIDKRTA